MGSLNSSVETLALLLKRIETDEDGWQRLQGLEGEEDHPQASPARHQGRRGVGHADQGHDCWRRRHPSHPQVSHCQEGRGPAAPVDNLVCQYFWYFVKTYPQRKTQDMKTDPAS